MSWGRLEVAFALASLEVHVSIERMKIINPTSWWYSVGDVWYEPWRSRLFIDCERDMIPEKKKKDSLPFGNPT